MRLRASSDELSDNELEAHGAGARGKCFGEVQGGFHQPHPPDRTKIGQAGQAPTHSPGPNSRPASWSETLRGLFPWIWVSQSLLLFWWPAC